MSGKRKKDIIKTVLVCLLQRRLCEKSLGILKREQGKLEAGEVLSMESVLYALAMKVLKEEEIRKVKEMMRMTLLGQMLREDGIKEGMERGEFKTMLELVRDGILTMKEAAARKQMSVEEFQEKIQELKLG